MRGFSLVVTSEHWIVEDGRITSFMLGRVKSLVKSGYLSRDYEQGGKTWYKIVGTKADYDSGTESFLGQH